MIRQGLKGVGLWALLFALLLRAMVPAGWMPGAAGGPVLLICSASGQRLLPPHADAPVPPAGDMAHQTCLFSGGLPLLPLPVGAGPMLPSGLWLAAILPLAPVVAAIGAPVRLPPATAPPSAV